MLYIDFLKWPYDSHTLAEKLCFIIWTQNFSSHMQTFFEVVLVILQPTFTDALIGFPHGEKQAQ